MWSTGYELQAVELRLRQERQRVSHALDDYLEANSGSADGYKCICVGIHGGRADVDWRSRVPTCDIHNVSLSSAKAGSYRHSCNWGVGPGCDIADVQARPPLAIVGDPDFACISIGSVPRFSSPGIQLAAPREQREVPARRQRGVDVSKTGCLFGHLQRREGG